MASNAAGELVMTETIFTVSLILGIVAVTGIAGTLLGIALGYIDV